MDSNGIASMLDFDGLVPVVGTSSDNLPRPVVDSLRLVVDGAPDELQPKKSATTEEQKSPS